MIDAKQGHLQLTGADRKSAVLEITQSPICRIGALLADPGEVQTLQQEIENATLVCDIDLRRFDSLPDLLDALAQRSIDLVLLDAQGCADGGALEVCREIRAAGHDQDILVLCEVVGEDTRAGLGRVGVRHFLRRDEGLTQRLDDIAVEVHQARIRGAFPFEGAEHSQPLSRRAAVESMCRTLSHQLMSSVTSIQEFLSIAVERGEGLDSYQQEYLNIARNSCDDLLRDMNDLISIAEMESCGIVIRPQVTNLGSLVESVIRPFYAVARRQNSELEYEVEVGLPPVMIDPVHGRRLLEILLRSVLVVKPTPAKVAVSVQQSELFGGGSEVRIAFRGPRVASESELDQFFDLHYQVQKTTGKQEGDFGFGLHVCKELVDLHGGHVAAEMEEGRVSAFVFHLRGITRAMATHEEWSSVEGTR